MEQGWAEWLQALQERAFGLPFNYEVKAFLVHRHEGSGSILAHLKEQGWATSLSAGEGSGSFSARSFFNVRVTLTDEGMRLCLSAMLGHTWQTPTCTPVYSSAMQYLYECIECLLEFLGLKT